MSVFSDLRMVPGHNKESMEVLLAERISARTWQHLLTSAVSMSVSQTLAAPMMVSFECMVQLLLHLPCLHLNLSTSGVKWAAVFMELMQVMLVMCINHVLLKELAIAWVIMAEESAT